MPPWPGRAIAVLLAAALLTGSARADDDGPGPAEVPEVPVRSSTEPAPTGPAPDAIVEPPTPPEFLGPAQVAAGVPLRVQRRSGEDTWLDAGHALVGRLLGTVLRFDRFFSDERQLDAERERSFLRWRNDVRVGTDTHRARYYTTVLGDLKFPGLNRWLERARLVIAGESEETAAGVGEGPAGSATPTSPGPARTVGRAAAELQYALFETFHVKTDVGAGLIVALPPGAVAHLRLRFAQPIGDVALFRTAWVTFARTDLHLGELAQADVERRFGLASLLRLSAGATANQVQRDRGIQWGSELAFIHAFGQRSAVSVGAGLDGFTLPFQRVNTYRVYARVRHDVFRQWIFLEVEPQVFWPFVPLAPRGQDFALTLRLEAQFQGEPDRPRAEPVPAAAIPPAEPEPTGPAAAPGPSAPEPSTLEPSDRSAPERGGPPGVP